MGSGRGRNKSHTKRPKQPAEAGPEPTEAAIVPEIDGCIEIDGSILEGGGQIVRIAFALAAVLQRPVKIHSIRKKRDKPGLSLQHLKGIEAVADCYGGTLHGAALRSQTVTFVPGEFSARDSPFEVRIDTAGSVALVIQVVLVPLLYGSRASTMIISGGTNAENAPPIDYLQRIFLPIARRFGLQADIELVRRGFFPKGNGEVVLRTEPVRQLHAIELMARGVVTHFDVFSFAAGAVPEDVPPRMAEAARQTVRASCREKGEWTVEAQRIDRDAAFGDGCGILVHARTSEGCLLAGSAIGQRGLRAETVGKNAGEMLSRDLDIGGAVDEFLQDQLIILMALARGRSRILSGPLSLHTQSAIHVCERLADVKFIISPAPGDRTGQLFIIECEGIGKTNEYSK